MPPSALQLVEFVELEDAMTVACEKRSKMIDIVEMRMSMAMEIGYASEGR